MKCATKWIAQLAILAAFILIGSLTNNSLVSAQDDGGDFRGGQFAVGLPIPPGDQASCEALGGQWIQDYCQYWDGRDEWSDYFQEKTGITTAQQCTDAGGTPATETGGSGGVTFSYCRNYEGYDAVINQAQAEGLENVDQDEEEIERECNAGGIGWFICPVTNMLAGAVDGMYGMLVNFVRIPPITTTGDNTQMYDIWVIFRNFANIVFVLLLLVALISQISNFGMSNYGIKRLLPRVIVAAVLVNISIYVCILMVDVSNIIGQSIYNLLLSVSGTIDVDVTGKNNEGVWAAVVAAILSGGTIGGVAMVTGGAAAMSSFGFIILPIVLMAVMAAFTAFIILALRYILIYLLIAVSPIAFVMYLLPNTAKYFDKWKDIFITILFFYPLFSLLFGAADLVSRMAISSASNGEVGGIGPIMLLFGLFIQVAPLVMSYKLLQTANSVAGTVTNGLQRRSDGFISAAKNRRNKGLSEASKASMNRMQTYGHKKGSGTLNPVARTGRMITGSKLRRGKTEDQREAWAGMAEHSFLSERGANDATRDANYDARAAKLGVSEINSMQQSGFIKALGETRDKLDANGDPINVLKNGIPTGETEKIYSPYAVIASGDDKSSIESITRQARAQQVSEERKSYTAEFSGSAIPQLRSALIEAMQSGNTSKTQALQSLLYGSGGKGVDTVREVISQEQSKGSAANQEVLSAMSQNILANHGDMKSRDNAQMEWAISGENIKSIVENPSFGANLSEKDKASQTPGNMYEMAKNGNLTGETAARILDNQNLSIGLKDDQRAILEALRDGTPLPTPPPSAPTAAKAPQPQPAAAAASTPQPPQPSNPPRQGPSAPPRQGPNNFNR